MEHDRLHRSCMVLPIRECVNAARLDLIQEFRKLWEQHDVWTRMTLLSIINGLPDEALVTARLLRNPKDFANLLKVFYGEATAGTFQSLLSDHLVIAAELVKASMGGDTALAERTKKRWYANAGAIAKFLGERNPYWSEQDWQRMMNEHLDLVLQEATDLMNKDYQGSIDTYDQLEEQSLGMADMLSEGIIRQFPYI